MSMETSGKPETHTTPKTARVKCTSLYHCCVVVLLYCCIMVICVYACRCMMQSVCSIAVEGATDDE